MYATADALVEPDWRDRGLLDTAVVVGALRQRRGRHRRGVLRGRLRLRRARRGVRLRRHGHHGRRPAHRDDVLRRGRPGRSRPCAATRSCCADAYTAELAAFVDAVRAGTPAPVTGEDARAALAIALAAAESVRAGRPVRIDEVAK